MEPDRTSGENQDLWVYDPAPGLFDLVNNNWLSQGVRLLAHLVIRGYLKLWHRVEFQGRENLRGLKGAILVANHTSHLDTLILFTAFPFFQVNRIRALAAKDYFFSNPFVRTVGFFTANTIPLDRQGLAQESFRYCRQKIDQGNRIILFPEGTRSPTGEVRGFKPGVGMLAQETGAPLVPFHIQGAFEAFPKGGWFPKPRKIRVNIGAPVHPAWTDTGKNRWLELAQELEKRVKALGKISEKQGDVSE